MSTSVGLIGYGRIGRDFATRIRQAPEMTLDYVLVRSETDDLSPGIEQTDTDVIEDRPVDLVVEAATPEALANLGERVLAMSDLMVLSGSAFANPGTEERLVSAAKEAGANLYLPHAALFGIDGLVDARGELDHVQIEATKAPAHLDFEYGESPGAVDVQIPAADVPELGPTDVTDRTVLYDGPTRGLCRLFPRNFNSHAVVALASLGLDDTASRLVADPAADGASHVITASGPDFDLRAVRDSRIEGVTGDYTLVSIWGSVRRVLDTGGGLTFV